MSFDKFENVTVASRVHTKQKISCKQTWKQCHSNVESFCRTFEILQTKQSIAFSHPPLHTTDFQWEVQYTVPAKQKGPVTGEVAHTPSTILDQFQCTELHHPVRTPTDPT